ncbi:MAG: hypothetical protein QGG42_06665 [Phycisphaerae bacterium]|jgi:hypothetical protein|nr:hypothetical protein [Phycisphaerae bacterium]
MSRKTLVLSVLAALLPPVIASAAPPIQAIKGVTPKPGIFRTASRDKPLVIRSAKEAGEHFPGPAVIALNKQVDFTQQVVLVFAWRGSDQDRLSYSVAESFPEQVFFKFRPGRTRDLRAHMKIFALRSNVRWRGPKGAGGGPYVTTKPVNKQLDAAKKHPRYKSIFEAKNVVVATLDRAQLGAVAESYPAIYEFELTLTVNQALRGRLKPKQTIQCAYSKTGKKKPAPPVGEQCLALLRTDRRGNRAYYLAPASKDLLKVARIAADEADKTDRANAALARDNPEKHPLYTMLTKADCVVVATGAPDGTASHNSRGVSTQTEICVVSMKGKLKPGDRFEAVFPASVAPNGKLPDTEFIILGCKRIAGKHRVTCLAEASDTNLRVAAAATGAKLRTLKDVRAIKLPTPKRTRFAPSRGRAGP